MAAHVSPAALIPRLLHGIPAGANPHLRVDGTVVLVDISGFTTLSEQLAAAGREGTEQLIATLSRIFTVLLPSADDGGDVVKFAGDALLVLFTGDDHARHAAHAAWNMNRVLAAIGDIHLAAARTKLRMSVGVHSGNYELLLTGVDIVSVVMTGRATSRVLELQSAASAGQILVSAETAALLPAKQVAADETPGAYRLLRAGSIASGNLMALSMGHGEASDRFLPRAFARRPDLLRAEPDHRWAALGFVQVSDVPEELSESDTERIARLTALVEDAAADTGVTLLDIDPAIGGYRYFLSAGAPTTMEDPEGRLLTATQRIVSNGAHSGFTLRAGVTSGRVFAGFVGAQYRQTYTVMGDATNMAARLTARAAPGTVLVSRAALERSAVVFDAADGGDLTLKGKTQTVPVAIVTTPGRRPAGGGAGEQSVAFVGRTAELEALTALRNGAMDGFGGVLTVVGGAGAGKTRLVAEALAGSALRIVQADGDRYVAGAPYRTLQTVLRQLLSIDADATAADAGQILTRFVAQELPAMVPWLPLLGPAVGAELAPSDAVDALDDAFRADRAHTVLSRLLTALMPAPSCIVIEDAHWVDAASAAALAHALGGDTPHCVVLTRRSGDRINDDAEADTTGLLIPGQRINLGPLSRDEASDLVEAVVGHALLPGDLVPLLDRAEGNPLYLIELAAGLSVGSETLGIEQLIGERLDALSESDRAIVRRTAVLGWGVPRALFVRCVGPSELAETDGVGGFLEVLEDTVRFRNELFRDVAYEQMNYQARRELHRAVAAILVAEPELAAGAVDPMLTVHYEAAGDWVNAELAATRTAEGAEHALALEDAVRAYRVAVAAGGHVRPTPAELPALWEALGRVSVAAGRATEGLDAFDHARAGTREPIVRARLDQQRAYALNVLGHPDQAAAALRTARRGAQSAGADGHGILASIDVTDAGVQLRQAHWAAAQTHAIAAITLLEPQAQNANRLSAADTRVLADAYRYHDIAASEIGGDEGMRYLDQALALYNELGDELSTSKLLSLSGVRAYYRGDWSLAADLYAQAHSAADAAGDVVGAAIESANAAEILIDQGRIVDARPLIKSALRVFSASDNPYLVAFVTGFAGRAALRAGEMDAAAAAFADAAARFAALDESDAVQDVRVRAIEADLALGELERAHATAEELAADASITGPVRSRLLRLRARIAAAHGDTPLAARLASDAAEVVDATPFERALSLAEHAVWDPGASTASATEALTVLGELDVADIPELLALPAQFVSAAPSSR